MRPQAFPLILEVYHENAHCGREVYLLWRMFSVWTEVDTLLKYPLSP